METVLRNGNNFRRRLNNPLRVNLALLALFISPLILRGQCADPANIPDVPFLGSIISPSCEEATGAIQLSNLPASGAWTVTRHPGTVESKGTGITALIEKIPAGIYYFTVTNDSGCTSSPSSSFTMPPQPPTPGPPVISEVILPKYPVKDGAVSLANLPSFGSWVLIRLPDSIKYAGTGSNISLEGIPAGEYLYVVVNYAGCISDISGKFQIPLADTPLVKISHPHPVCFPQTADITAPEITYGSTPGLIYSYWHDSSATKILLNPENVPAGHYYIKGTNEYMFFSVKPVDVVVKENPLADAGSDQELDYSFQTTLNAIVNDDITGEWSVLSGTAFFEDPSGAGTKVTNLSEGDNVFLWTVSDGVCPLSFDTVHIYVNDLSVPSLITPNMDGINDYLVIKRKTNEGRIYLVIFDRRGLKVFEDNNYDNSWNGVDNKGKDLPSDTYYYTLRMENGIKRSSFIVIRR